MASSATSSGVPDGSRVATCRRRRRDRTRGRWTLTAAVGALALLLTACGTVEEDTPEPPAAATSAPAPEPDEAEPGASEPDPEPSEPATLRSLVATATVDEVMVFADADTTSERTHTLSHPTERGVPRVFLVETRRDGWLEVLLPVRPNGSTGWIRESDVELAANPYRIDIRLAEHALTIHREGELVLETAIGYGADDTPTPGGRYYLTELLQPPDPGGVYGPFAFGLSGFSDVHLDFAGGEGVIGIHGTNQPDSIGSTVSNGCIRVPNDVITEMASFLPLGTPVAIS